MSSSRILKSHHFDSRVLLVRNAVRETVDSIDRCEPQVEIEAARREAFDEATRQAKKLIDSARLEASRIIEQARAEAKKMEEEAFERGYQEGIEHGTAVSQSLALDQIRLVTELAQNAKVEKDEMIRETEREIVALALEVARKIIVREVSLDRTVVTRIIENALQRVQGSEPVKIRINPSDLEAAQSWWDRAQEESNGSRNWELVADKRVKSGGCIIETSSGVIDAQIDSQLAEIKKSFETVNRLE